MAFPQLEKENIYDVAFVDYELMEEPEKVIEKSSIRKGKDSEQDVSCDVKTKQDAENLAIKLLATRLEYYFLRILSFRTYRACVSASASRRR